MRKPIPKSVRKQVYQKYKIGKDIRQTGRISEKTFSSERITNVSFVESKIMLSAKMAQKLS